MLNLKLRIWHNSSVVQALVREPDRRGHCVRRSRLRPVDVKSTEGPVVGPSRLNVEDGDGALEEVRRDAELELGGIVLRVPHLRKVL